MPSMKNKIFYFVALSIPEWKWIALQNLLKKICSAIGFRCLDLLEPNFLRIHLIVLQRMSEASPETITTPPKVQKLERLQTIEKEHKDALERAVSLNIPHAVTADNEELPVDDQNEEASPCQNEDAPETESTSNTNRGRTNWDEVVKKLYKKKETANLQVDVVQ